MILSKKAEAELLRVYKSYWQGYTTGDVKSMAALLDKRYTQVGSAEAEVFYNKKDAVKFLHDTIDQVAGKAEIKNSRIKVEVFENDVLINDLMDLYVLTDDEWVFYAKFRASTLMKEVNGKWKIIHQHSSIPDIRTQDGENLSTEKIAAENLRLKDAVRRRTIELEQKNRDLEIEASLERVRVRAMAMHNTSELWEVIKVVFKQFEVLKMPLDSCFINIFAGNSRSWNIWIAAGGQTYASQTRVPFINHPAFNRLVKARKNGELFYTQNLNRKFKDRFFDNFFKNARDIKVPQNRKKLIIQGTGIYQAVTLSKHASIHLANYRSINYSKEELQILQRIGQVFEQTYTRFLDLKKAEEQAREAEIEVSLEKIRSRSLAMHDSEELSEVAMLLNNELRKLGFPKMFEAGYIQFEGDKEFQKGWLSDFEGKNMEPFALPLKGDVILDERFNSWKKQQPLLYQEIGGKKLYNHLQFCMPTVDSKQVREQVEKHFSDPTHFYHGFFKEGALCVITQHPLDNQQQSLIVRFTRAFEQTYTRFLDLKKAEEHAKEAQIEAALERVRSKSMAMHKSEDIGETVSTLFGELLTIGIHKSSRSGIGILDETKNMKLWSAISNSDDEVNLLIGKLDMTINPLLKKIKNTWKKQDEQFYYELEGKELSDYYASINQSDTYSLRTDLNKLPEKEFIHVFTFKLGIIYSFNSVPISEEAKQVFIRFAKVFEQTYTRFLDLQKAEEQAREAQIEVALERVRARTMAMHKGAELAETSTVLFEQISDLGIQPRSCGFLIMDEESKSMEDWSTNLDEKGTTSIVTGTLAFDQHPLISQVVASWRRSDPYFVSELHGKELQKYYTVVTAKESATQSIKDQVLAKSKSEYTNSFNFEYGMMYLLTPEEITQHEIDIMLRFAGVFKLTYRRFLDLKKAEEQARLAQIEASLERVRASTMAMHKSEDVASATIVMFEQLTKLGVISQRCGIAIPIDSKTMEFWAATTNKQGEYVRVLGEELFSLHPALASAYKAWKLKKGQQTYVLKGKNLIKYYQAVKATMPLPEWQQKMRYAKGGKEDFSTFPFSDGWLYIFTDDPLSEDAAKILSRFSQLFDLTYRRYLDLQKAENQTREAQIETSLERVRSKAMAMHSSEDLVDTASQLFKEFQHLQISFIRCGVLKIKKDRTAEVYSYSHTKENEAVAVFGNLNLSGHELVDGVFNHWLLQEEYYHEMKKEAVKRYYQLVNKQINIPKLQLNKSHFAYAFYFPEGCLYCFTNEKLPEELLQVLRKFNKVMGLTYRRYFELMKAEARELEAIKESSLDRVRAEIASMRTAADLNRITPIVWKELTTLGVPFFRCGIFIMNEEEEMVHVYLSTPTGKSLAALHLDFNDKDIVLIEPSVDKWRKQEVYRHELSQQQFIEQTKLFMAKGQIKSPKKYQHGDVAPKKLVLQLVPFKQGMLYAGSAEPLIEKHINLMQDLANAFSIAYSRYEDFKQLEEAKEVVEGTLTELKSTQTQLVQSEKMASLGELTAGIAHEIQNPLNFVNNFSEVSSELIEEMNEEINAGNLAYIKEISDDLKQNLEKINNHGQRASSIVKGMLEHSRTGDGKKVPTDINKLADEYLRLSYHGLRAKDKSFNADFKMDLEPNLPRLNVVPQDFGRVMLNLINNAFQAVSSEAAAKGDSSYKPIVEVITKLVKNRVEIRVKDNGTGIPENIKDKIFEPFFTTKPTGQGTGLGLSMSFDIITKGHGGELKVDSKDGEGTAFIISLPYN